MPIILDNSISSSGIVGSSTIWGTITGTLSNQTDLQNSLSSKIPNSEKGVSSGIATLDATAKLTISQLPTSVQNLIGTWDADSNMPALTSGVGTNGDTYIVDTAGNTNLDGNTDWIIGDQALFIGGAINQWQKLDNTLTQCEVLDFVEKVNNSTGYTLSGGSTISKEVTVTEDSTIDQNLSSTASVTHMDVTLTNQESHELLSTDVTGKIIANPHSIITLSYARIFSVGTDTEPTTATTTFQRMENFGSVAYSNLITTDIVNGRLTITQDGLYRAYFFLTNHDGDHDQEFALYKNGVIVEGVTVQINGSNQDQNTVIIYGLVSLLDGDYLEIFYKVYITGEVYDWQSRAGVTMYFEVQQIPETALKA